jgi:hypothetical protein
MLNTNSSQQSAYVSVDAPIAVKAEGQVVEVSGLMDDFISIEEFSPGSDWKDVLASAWGVPAPMPSSTGITFLNIKDLVRSLRSIVHQSRAKKFEVA